MRRSRVGVFLTVLKTFGDVPSPGLMSFPRKGVTICFDMANRGLDSLELMESLDRIVLDKGGSVYPAKDARMSAVAFKKYFPQWERFKTYVDPTFSSSFWRRVTL